MTDTPPGLVRLPLGKGCLLVLTEQEYRRGILRGKTMRRRETLVKRTPATAGEKEG